MLLKKGQIRTVFLDYQEDRTPLGVARLISKVDDGLPFILRETKESETIVYNYEIWEVKFLEYTDEGEIYAKQKKKFPIRFVESVGIKSSNEPSELKTSNLIDKFIEFNGKEIY